MNVGYAVFVGLGLIAGYLVKVSEERRLNLLSGPHRRWVAVGAVAGALVGAKVGLLLYMPWGEWVAAFPDILLLEWGGKTILGALFGGFIGVEGVKAALGITIATGDPFALALPVGQAIGRIGCYVGGCCYGATLDEGHPLRRLHFDRHPAQLYEAAFDLALAAVLFSMRKQPRPLGLLFRYYLVAYASVRFALDFFRGDEKVVLGPFSLAQWFCAFIVLAMGLDIFRRTRVTA